MSQFKLTKTITKPKFLHKGAAMVNLNKKYMANSFHIFVHFSESQSKPTILLSDLNREYDFLLELNWLARKTLKKTTYCTAFEAQRRRHTLTHTQVS